MAHLSYHLSVSLLSSFPPKKHLSLTYKCLLLISPCPFCSVENGIENNLFKRMNCLKTFNDFPFSQDTIQAPYFNYKVLHNWLPSTFPIPFPPFFISPPQHLLRYLARALTIFHSSSAKLLTAPGLCACISSIWHMFPLASSISSAMDICCFCLPSTLSSTEHLFSSLNHLFPILTPCN